MNYFCVSVFFIVIIFCREAGVDYKPLQLHKIPNCCFMEGVSFKELQQGFFPPLLIVP